MTKLRATPGSSYDAYGSARFRATPRHASQIANDRARSGRRRALGRDVKNRPTGGALARFSTAHERDRA
jgi:hypothetical protein